MLQRLKKMVGPSLNLCDNRVLLTQPLCSTLIVKGRLTISSLEE